MKKVIFWPFIIPLLLGLCTLFYYFGELVDWAAWDSLRNNFFYGIHDIHRLLFLIPIVGAAYLARVKGAVIVTLASFAIFLPRAFFISPYPDPLLRMVLFVVFAGVIGVLVGIVRNQSEKSQRLEATATADRNRLLNILNGMADGVVITDRDYTIRYMNAKMMGVYGNGIGSACYRHLRQADSPCLPECRIADVIDDGYIKNWRCPFPDGKTYEVTAAPYVDSDGAVCQISVFRDTAR